jgi:hypothetical protein
VMTAAGNGETVDEQGQGEEGEGGASAEDVALMLDRPTTPLLMGE